MMAARAAAQAGHTVDLYEQNEKVGKKLYITGKGRCNITNACDVEDLIGAVVHNPKFMYSGFYSFTNEQMMAFMTEQGVPVKVERGNRVFPVSDKASDVIAALKRSCDTAGVVFHLNTKVDKLLHNGKKVHGIALQGKEAAYDSVIVATGGLSYRMTGATGDGYRFAKETGHRLVATEPGLVPFNIQEGWVKSLQGLSLKNVTLSIFKGKKTLTTAFGEMMFTHFGITGPIVLTAASDVREGDMPLEATIDLKPKLSEATLDERLQKDFAKYHRKDFANSLDDLLPRGLIPVVIALSGIDPHKKVDQINREERHHLMKTLKGLRMTVTGKRSWNEAIITQGGVSVKDIDPATMESKKMGGLYFVGEVLDLDAITGGFNLQIAYSTGYLAGIAQR